MKRNPDGRFARQPIVHGTHKGFRQHERHGVPDTPECGCRDAYNAYKNDRHKEWRKEHPSPPRDPWKPEGTSAALQRALDERWFITRLSLTQAAARLGCNPRTVQRYRALLRAYDLAAQTAAGEREEDDDQTATDGAADAAPADDRLVSGSHFASVG